MRRAVLALLLAGLIAARAADAGPPDDGVRLAGTVTVGGKPAEGILVELRPRSDPPPVIVTWYWTQEEFHPERAVEPPLPPGPPLAATRSSKGGRFAFPGLGVGRYVVVATAPDGRRGWRSVVLPYPRGVHDVDVHVVAGSCEVRGRLRRRDGSPFTGQIVLSRTPFPWNYEDDFVTAAAMADEEGRFWFRGVPPGFAEITVVEPGRLRASLGPVLCPASAPLDLVVDERLAVTAGRVVDPTGAPVAGVTLVARGDGPNGAIWRFASVAARAVADDEGRFRMIGPLAPEFRVAGTDRWLLRAEPLGPPDGELTLLVRPRPRLRGVVRRTEDGAPVAGVPVICRSVDDEEPPVLAVSDAEGRYEIAAPGRFVETAAWGRGWVPADTDDTALSLTLDAGETREMDLPVVPAARLSGHVHDTAGAPVAGAVADLGLGILSLMGEGSAATRLVTCLPAPVSDADGKLEIDYLPVGWSGRLEVRAGATEGEVPYGEEEEEDFDVTLLPSANRHGDGRVVLPPGASIGDVRLPDGLYWSGVDGRFWFSGEEPETVRITAWFGDVFHRAEVEVRPGADTEVVLRPAEAENPWLVKVLDPEGRPVPGGDARFLRPDRRGGRRFRFVAGRAWSWIPSTGERRIRVLACRDERGRPLPYAPFVSEPLPVGVSTIRLAPGRTVEGRVTTIGDRPVRGATIWTRALEDRGESAVETQSDVDGRFRLVGLAETACEVRVRPPRAWVKPDPIVLAADADRLDVRLVPKVAPRVRVLDPDDRPVAGARVAIESPDEGTPFEVGRLTGTTNADGVALFPLVPPGPPVALRVTPPTGADILPLDRPTWRPADETVRLARAFSIEGTVVDAAGEPVPDATVFVRAEEGAPPLPAGFSFTRIEGGSVLAAIADPDGRFAIGPLPATRLRIFAALAREDGTASRTPVAVTASGTNDLVLRLP